MSPKLPARYPTRGTQEHLQPQDWLRLRGFHPLWRPIPGDFGFPAWGFGGSYNPTSPYPYG